jgi:hypothetical protein
MGILVALAAAAAKSNLECVLGEASGIGADNVLESQGVAKKEVEEERGNNELVFHNRDWQFCFSHCFLACLPPGRLPKRRSGNLLHRPNCTSSLMQLPLIVFSLLCHNLLEG